MILTKRVSRCEESMVDEYNRRQGLVNIYYDAAHQHIKIRGFALDDRRIGEYKSFTENGSLYKHDYVDLDSKSLINLLNDPVTDPEEKMFLKLKHGGDWLPDDIN